MKKEVYESLLMRKFKLKDEIHQIKLEILIWISEFQIIDEWKIDYILAAYSNWTIGRQYLFKWPNSFIRIPCTFVQKSRWAFLLGINRTVQSLNNDCFSIVRLSMVRPSKKIDVFSLGTVDYFLIQLFRLFHVKQRLFLEHMAVIWGFCLCLAFVW